MNRVRKLERLSGTCVMAVLAFTADVAWAQQGASMPAMDMGSTMDPGSDGSTKAYQAADREMMRRMQAPVYTGDADKDFVAHMIPHHQGAVAMAEVELKYGKDPEMKKLARSIIKAQKQEVGIMKRWQAGHGGR